MNCGKPEEKERDDIKNTKKLFKKILFLYSFKINRKIIYSLRIGLLITGFYTPLYILW